MDKGTILLIAAVWVCMTLPIAQGLRCYSCVSAATETSNSSVNSILGSMKNEDCREDGINPSGKVVIIDCPGAASCLKGSLSVQSKVLSFDFTTKIIQRGCPYRSDLSNGCSDPDSTIVSGLNTLFDSEGSGVSLGTVTGQVCACAGELCNSQAKSMPTKVYWVAGLLAIAMWFRIW